MGKLNEINIEFQLLLEFLETLLFLIGLRIFVKDIIYS